MNARAYDYSTICTTYTLTDPTDKQGKLVRVVGNLYYLSDKSTEVKSTGIPGIWYNNSGCGQNEVKSGDLCVFLGNVEKSYPKESWAKLSMPPKVYPAYLLLHCKSGELLAFRVDDVTLLWHWLEEVKGEEENGW